MQAALKQQEGVGGIEGATVTDLFAEVPNREELKNAAAQSTKWNSQFNQAVNGEFNKLSETEKSGILAEFKEGHGQTKEEYIFEKLEALPGNKVINQVTLSRIDELKLKRDSYQDTHRQAISEGFKFSESDNIKKVVEEY